MGGIDLIGMLGFLRDIDYQGWLTIEIENPAVSPRASVWSSVRYLRSIGMIDQM
jgi:sugar phosphate isomerase/epimerase